MEKKQPIIELKHIKKCYTKDVPVIYDFNLTINEGEFVTFLGPSGCGKTTILRMLAGFETPTSGEILFNGKDISELPPNERKFNTVFQKYALFPHLNIYDNISFGLKEKKVPKDEIEKKVKRVLEIVDLEDKIVSEFKGNNDSIEGKITIGCGEFLAVESLAKICKNYREKYPLVQFAIHTGTADNVLEMMNKGLVDIGLFLEPVNTQGLDYIRMPENDHWVVTMRPDDPLAEKEVITKNDLLDVPLILPERMNVQSELANWFGKDFGKLHIAFTSNLGTNAGVMALHGLGYPVSIEGAARYWRNDLVVQKRLFPELKTSTVIAWRRNIPYSPAVSRFIEELN